MITNRPRLNLDEVRGRLSDATCYAFERAAFFGREAIVSIRMGDPELAYQRTCLAARWALETGRVAPNQEPV